VSILRVKRTKGYTTIPNSTLCDHRLSFRARGVLAFLLAKPDDWETRTTDLPEHGREGRDAVRTALKELRELGYMDQEREQYRDDESGKWLWRTVTIVRDFPEPENPTSEVVPETDSQSSETSWDIPTTDGGSGDGFSGAPLLSNYLTTSSSKEIEETTSLLGARRAEEETPTRPGSKGWGAVKPVYRPKKKSRKQQAEEAALAEKELDPAYVVAQALGGDDSEAAQEARLPASDDDLAPPVRQPRKPRSKRPCERLAEYFEREARRVGSEVPGTTNRAALARNLQRWLDEGAEYSTVSQMIGTYWSESWRRSDADPAWKDFQNQRGLLTQRLKKVENSMEKHRHDESFWD
jgi:hypothetical protein